MKKFSKFIAEHSKLILIISIILLIPAILGYVNTRINYDILVYLPENVETIQGEKILTEDFGLGAYAFVMVDSTSSKRILNMEEKIKNIEGVNQVFSIADIIDTTIPMDMLPSEIVSKINKNNETVIVVTFDGSTSEDITIEAVRTLRETVEDASHVSSMTSMVIDTRDLSSKEIFAYVTIAVIFCLAILMVATDSYIIPILLLSNIGVAILYNMGTNIFLGEISYITKAITAILQLGVTTDFSIFLYHKYEQAKRENEKLSKTEAMADAITQTFKSVIGSSLTTFAGFLALCTMDLTLGTDIGIVMAKGVLCGLICVLTLFPALLLTFDKVIEKTKHKMFFPKFIKVQEFCVKHYKGIIAIFLILLIPAYIGNSKYDVYYKLDESLPQDLAFNVANSKLAEEFNIISPEIILINKDIKTNKVKDLTNELKNVEGIDLVLAPSTLMENYMIDLLPSEITSMLENEKYQLLILNSIYEIASDELSKQIDIVNDIVKKYDESGIIAGEGPLMKDLVTIADHDFRIVNYTSIAVIFVIMVFVLRQISLPIILVLAIEFAIFINMAVAYFTGASLPFIASIVVGTIQLGATIDYAILMSTKYLEERNIIKDKFAAMKKTLSLTVTSIITSALCFFAATFGVAMYTKIDMIGSICELLARGSIISMLVVVLILPSLLLIFDRIIVKNQKKEGKNMKKLSKVVSVSLISMLLLQPTSALAMTKSETVYANLDYTGNSYKTVVNNHLYINDIKTIKDETTLTNILNLNGEENFTLDGKNLSWDAIGKDIFYQGETKECLPISVIAKYYLDNKEVDAKEIVGKEGNVKIELKFLNNTYLKSKDMYVPFVVAVGTILDSEENTNIEVVNGKSVDTGSNNYVVGLASPGLYENLNLKEFKNFDKVVISYETTNFSLNDIYIVATPKLIEDTDFAIFNKVSELNSSIKLIQENMDKLESGAKELAAGSSSLLSGSSKITMSLKQVLAGVEELQNGSSALANGTNELYNSLLLASKSLQDPSIAGSIANVMSVITNDANKIKELMIDPVSNKDMIELLKSNIDNFQVLLQILNTTNDKINEMIELLILAVDSLNKGANNLDAGLETLKNSVNALYKGSSTLNKGVKDLNVGTKTLSLGITTLNKEGINKLSSYAEKANNYSKRAKSLVKLSKDYNGFSSNNVDNTTFIYKISN